MDEALTLALLQLVPAIISAGTQMAATASQTNLAALQAALSAARTAALADEAQAVIDLDAAAAK
jgi:hypothetical protein